MAIKIENVVTPSAEQWEAIIRGTRNPMNSWSNSDSYKTYIENEQTGQRADFEFFVGDEDLKLMQKLAKAGTDHRKFMRMITVYVDVTAPLYWWKEADTYKVGTVRNSCSTMHKITEKEFTLDDFSHEHLDMLSTDMLTLHIIPVLNIARSLYIGEGSPARKHDKNDWWQIIQLLPSSYNQRATLMLNYEVLANMYHSRKNHKLDEWREFCSWIETLPYAKELICGE